GNPLGLQRDDFVIEQSDTDHTALMLANIGGSSICLIDVAGNFRRELSGAGERPTLGFATDWLVKLYCSEVWTPTRGAPPRWNAAPYVGGAMSVAAIGGQGARKVLTESLGGLFFAGEATHETLAGTVAGAWDSGERAAEGVLRRFGLIKEPAPEAAPRKGKRSRSVAPS